MGYYVKTGLVLFTLAAEHYDAAYQAVCELNKRNDLKSGGTMSRTKLSNGCEDGRADRNKWFAWMYWNYPEYHKSLNEVLTELGFTVTTDEYGIKSLSYDNKMGDERWFLATIAPFVKSGSTIEWIGEDDHVWVHLFDHGKLYTNEFLGGNNYEELFIPN